MANIILSTLYVLIIITTALPTLCFTHCRIRIFDFPRKQIISLAIIALLVDGVLKVNSSKSIQEPK